MGLTVLVGAAVIAFLLMFPPRKARLDAPFRTPPATAASVAAGSATVTAPAARFTASVDLFRDTLVFGEVARGEQFRWPWQSDADDAHACRNIATGERNYALGERFDPGAASDAENLSYEARRAIAVVVVTISRCATDRRTEAAIDPPLRHNPSPLAPSGPLSFDGNDFDGTVVGFDEPLLPPGLAASRSPLELRFGLGALPSAPAGASLRVSVTCNTGQKVTAEFPATPGRYSDHILRLEPRTCVDGPRGIRFTASNSPVLLAHPRLWYTPARPAATHPNVVLVNVDTLLPAALGFMGGETARARGATPNLDRLAAEGISWDQTYANGNWSKPSHASFFTSVRPHDLGLKIWRNANDGLEQSLWRALRHRTLVQAFRDAGYFTYGAASNLFDSPVLPTGVDLGFERFTDNPASMDHPLELLEDLEDFLATQRDAPFFVFFNPETPHYKYRPPREYLFQTGGVKSLESLDWDLYVGEVAYGDAYVGRLLAMLDHYGLRENTLVMITSDHGEQLAGAHAQAVYLRDPFEPFAYYARDTTRFRHGLSPYDEEWHVPWLVRLPAGAQAGTRIAAQVEVLDQAPTLLALAGLPPEPSFRGRTVFPQAPSDRPAFLEGRNFDAIRLPPWKYVRRLPGTDLVAPAGTTAWRHAPESLFDLSADPLELKDLAAERPDVLAEFRARWRALRGPPQALWRVRRAEEPGGGTARGRAGVPGLGEAHAAPLTGRVSVDDAAPLAFELSSVRPEFVFTAPEDAVVTLDAACAPNEVRIGALALPLVETLPARFGPTEARATLALTAPIAPQGARLLLWRTPLTDGGPETTDTGALGKDLQDALRSWGYAN